MIIHAVLGNPNHPEYGVATIPFPIPHGQYAHCIQCACRLTERSAADTGDVSVSKRKEIKLLLRRLRQGNPNIEKSIFNSIHVVALDTMPGFKTGGVEHSFLERFNAMESTEAE